MNTTCKALFALNVDTVISAVNMPQTDKYAAITIPEGSSTHPNTGKTLRATSEIQNKPKELNAVAPNVLPLFISHIPARIWAIPP